MFGRNYPGQCLGATTGRVLDALVVKPRISRRNYHRSRWPEHKIRFSPHEGNHSEPVPSGQ